MGLQSVSLCTPVLSSSLSFSTLESIQDFLILFLWPHLKGSLQYWTPLPVHSWQDYEVFLIPKSRLDPNCLHLLRTQRYHHYSTHYARHHYPELCYAGRIQNISLEFWHSSALEDYEKFWNART